MRFQPGIAACLLAGCMVQPVVAPPGPDRGGGPRAAGLLPAPSQVLRISLEHLTPDDRSPDLPPARVEAPFLAAVEGKSAPQLSWHRPRETREPGDRLTELDRVDVSAIDDPIARETFRFVRDLVATDQMRVRREIGIPFFEFRRLDAERGPLLTHERTLQDDHEQWVQEHGMGLLQRPMRLLLRRLPFVNDLNLEFQDFRSEHLPLTDPYQSTHRGSGDLGRVSLRVRAGDLGDPVEVVYVYSGVRIGTSQGRGKLALDFGLTENLAFELRAHADYATAEFDLRIDLIYRASERTSLHLAVGDNMDFLSTSSLYSLFESPMDGSPGLVVYAVHTF